MMVGQACAVLAARAVRGPIWRGILQNRPLLVALPATLVVLALMLTIPILQQALHLAPLAPTVWAISAVVGAAAALCTEPLKVLRA
jgi:hypothetical protein